MIECKAILPSPFGGNGAGTLTAANDLLRLRLLEIAGGYTLTHGMGAWRNGAGTEVLEPVNIYSVAVLPEREHAVRHAAIECARMAEQAAVYFSGTHGPEIIGLDRQAA